MTKKKKISEKVKKQLAKEVGRQVKKLVQKNIKGAPPEVLSYANKFAERKTLSVIEEKRFLSQETGEKPKKFKIRIKGIKNVVEDVFKGEKVKKSVRNNLGVSASFNVKW